ncbi:MAG TPA: UDP-N-acetylglucosamine 2-epimerase, partial [Gammaproteobacteria bacterium]|nr:UDP-N-acetylglucosamine 2-epimerase [Gammaproteobacteria bacterium]
RDTLREADELYRALDDLPQQTVFCFPNSDAGSRELIRRARAFCDTRERAALFVNLNPVVYWSLLRNVSLMLGNSSSGIMETPSLALPTINIGMRQQGRERARNIIDVAADGAAILDAVRRGLDPSYRASLEGMQNPYGDGRAAERIVRVLAQVPLGERLLLKKAVALDGD